MRTLLATVVFLTLGTKLKADMTVKDYRANMASSNPDTVAITRAWIMGLGEGTEWTNTELVRAGKLPLYCQPPKLALGMDNYVDMINRRIEANKDNPSLEIMHIGSLLIRQLADTFPCSADKK